MRISEGTKERQCRITALVSTTCTMQFQDDIKPPQGLALIKFPDGFDADMSYWLRERNYATLEDMQKSVVSVEENILAKRARQRTKRRVTIKEDPSTSSSDTKLDSSGQSHGEDDGEAYYN
jgi:hypothetical protein